MLICFGNVRLFFFLGIWNEVMLAFRDSQLSFALRDWILLLSQFGRVCNVYLLCLIFVKIRELLNIECFLLFPLAIGSMDSMSLLFLYRKY